MGLGFLSILGEVIKPVTGLIDELTTTDEEKGQLRNELTKVENMFAKEVLAYETKIMQMQADVIMTEAKGDSWLQRSWRPVTMLSFLVLVVCDSFGWLVTPIAPQMWSLLQLGLGGYVVGRSAEKIIPKVLTKWKE